VLKCTGGTDAANCLTFNNATFNFDTDTDTDRTRGGKLIMYHGWADRQITPLSSIDYYQQVQAAQGQAGNDSFLKRYMLPGGLSADLPTCRLQRAPAVTGSPAR
jgi:hypothetical protein